MLTARMLAAGGLAAAGAALVRRVLTSVADEERWTRTNHRGEPVSLLEGPAVGAGLLLGAAVAPGRAATATALAAAGGLAFGLVDDLTEDPSTARKGLRGHLGAMAHGELTTGGLKVLGIGVTSVAAAAIAIGRPPGSRIAWGADVLGAGALVASTANLVNLLDLRPGRALKVVGLAALPGLGGAGAPAAAAVLGAAGAALRDDLAERDMLGDGGANALGAALGTAAVLSAPRGVRLGLLAGVVALTIASERISFSQVIARTPGLRELDALGRRRAGAT